MFLIFGILLFAAVIPYYLTHSLSFMYAISCITVAALVMSPSILARRYKKAYTSSMICGLFSLAITLFVGSLSYFNEEPQPFLSWVGVLAALMLIAFLIEYNIQLFWKRGRDLTQKLQRHAFLVIVFLSALSLSSPFFMIGFASDFASNGYFGGTFNINWYGLLLCSLFPLFNFVLSWREAVEISLETNKAKTTCSKSFYVCLSEKTKKFFR